MRTVLFILFSTLTLAASGCGGSGSPTVSGTVTFDGQPLPDGDIMFVDSDAKVAPDAGKIKDGKYSFPVKPGKKKVEIRASKVMPLPKGQEGAMGEKEGPVDYIPAKYNTKTELTADVGSTTTFDFPLKP